MYPLTTPDDACLLHQQPDRGRNFGDGAVALVAVLAGESDGHEAEPSRDLELVEDTARRVVADEMRRGS